MKKLLVVLLAFLTISLSGCVTVNIYFNGAGNGKEDSSSSSEESLSGEETSSAPSEEDVSGEDESGPSEESGEEELSGSESSSDGDVAKPYDAKYGKAGTFDYEQSLNTVTIQAEDVVLKNKTILKNLYIRSGSVTLENCNVQGTIIFTGGGSLVLKSCTAASVGVKSGEDAMLKLYGSSIGALELTAGCTVQALDGGCSVGSVAVLGKEISVTLDSLSVASVTMDEEASLRLQNGSSVDEAEVYAPCTLSSETGSDCVYKKVSVLPGRGYVKIHLRIEDALFEELNSEESVYPELIGKAKINAYSGDGSIYTS
ncbi:MAG TPA: hypothetical protein PLU75_06320 [Oscillospiraceae bacterium]|nr:hypothetical protein [Oscillospiraceae bacterium]HRW57734.1 hypothetical protein [Oscillospiraceae bacterium]